MNPLEAQFSCLLVNVPIMSYRRLGLCYWVNLPPELFRVQRIADFGENVYILYVAELAQDCMFLLSSLISY